MAHSTPRFAPRLLLLLAILLIRLTCAQQVGSFFTAIYINGAPAGSNYEICSAMAQPNYCCAQGQSCAWDDAGKVACCASGGSCQGTAAYSGGNQGQYYTSPTPTYQQQCGGGCCGCPPTTTYVNPAPPVVVTLATSYYVPVTTTYVQPQATAVVVQTVVNNAPLSTIGPVACATVSTVTYANVGAPVKTVGCFIIINDADNGRSEGLKKKVVFAALLGIFGSCIL